MPQYSSVLVNKLTSNWESVSNVERTLHFVLTARDNATMGTAQTASDETIINVKGDTGPFEITTQNIENDSWKQGFEQIIKWNVNKSNKLEGASHVNIKLSIDGGLSFSIVLASNVPNDGQAKITAPNIIAKVCRLLIEPTNNIFYAINSQPFSIGYTVEKTSNTFAFPTPLAIPEQDSYSSLFINYPETSATISDIKVNVNVTHSLFSDLQMDIQNPHGNTVQLFKPSCNNNGTLNLVFDDYGAETKCGNQNLQTIAPYESLSVFYDKNPTGIWVFRIRDNSLGNLGTLNAVSLSIITKKYSVMKPEFRILNLKTFSKNNDGTFTVNFEGDDTAPVLILIYNLLGQKVFQKEYPKTFFFDEEIQIPNPKSGMYLLDVVVLNKKASAKILVK